MAADDAKEDLEALSALETEAREFDKVSAAYILNEIMRNRF